MVLCNDVMIVQHSTVELDYFTACLASEYRERCAHSECSQNASYNFRQLLIINVIGASSVINYFNYVEISNQK
jgi:hypothetical protein